MLFLKVFIGLSIFTHVRNTFPLSDCRSRDMDIIFAIDCKYPIEGIQENIKNILLDNFVNTTSKSSTRNLRVSVTDLRSSENLIFVDVEPIENYDTHFANLCSASYRDGVNVDEIYLDKFEIVDYLPTSSLIIWIMSCIEYEQFSRKIDIILFVNYDACDYYRELGYDYYVVGVDDFKANHHLSLILCDDCSAGWFPLRNKYYEITSCFHLMELNEPVSWKNATDICKQIKSNLVTMEEPSDILALPSEVLKFRQILGDSSTHESGVVVDMFIGISYFITGHNGPLLWINGRPVVLSSINEAEALVLKCFPTRLCFSWKIYNVSYNTIYIDNCKDATKTYNLCKTELSRYEIDYDYVVFDKHSEVYVYDQQTNAIVSVSDSRYLNNGIYSDKKNFPTFACSPNGPFISYRYVCDGYKDCNTGEDETVCKLDSQKCKEVDSFMCLNRELNEMQCVPKTARCNLIEDCLDGSDELDCDGCVGTRCVGDVCIPNLWPINCTILANMHLFPDNFTLRQYDLITFCNKTLQETERKSFTFLLPPIWAPRCLYSRGLFGNILGCHNKSHLHDCENFTCPTGFLKCSMSYCIPVYLANDGMKDCPHGEDESFKLYSSNDLYLCYDSSIRVHLLNICDGHPQCPRGDDEFNCNLQCPLGFKCLDGTVTINDTSTSIDFSLLPPDTTYLNIAGIDISLTKVTNNKLSFSKLLVFIASWCNITDVVQFRFKINFVYLVDVSFNHLTKLVPGDFLSDFVRLYTLNASHNSKLEFIDTNYFSQFKNLKTLDLSFTKITDVSVRYNAKLNSINLQATYLINLNLSHNSTYELIDLRNSKFSTSIPEHYFLNISVSGQILADPGVCCPLFRGPKIPEHKCLSEINPVSTCDDLIGDFFKRSILWLVALCSVIGNLIVLWYRIFFDKATLKLTYGILVTCLGVSDLMMGTYLVIIGAVDLYYREVYISHQMAWRQSPLCRLSGALATMSGETSTFFIFLITIERYLTIKYPLGQRRFPKFARNLCIVLSWLLGILLAAIPSLYPDLSLYSASGVCLGFPLRKSTGQAWIYSVVIFLILNSLIFVLSSCGQVAIFYLIYTNNAKFKDSDQQFARRAEDIAVAKRLALVVVSNLICLLPVCILGLKTATSDFEVDRQAYAWIVALVLPANSAMNPFLYTIPGIYRKWEEYKNGPNQRRS